MPLKELNPQRPPGQPGSEPFKPQVKLQWTAPFPLGRGGENTRQPASELQTDQAVLIRNGRIEVDRLEQAWGYTEISDLPGTILSDPEIKWIGNYESLSGSRRLIHISEDFLYENSGGSWTRRTLSGGPAYTFTNNILNAAMVQDELIIVGPGDDILRWSITDNIVAVLATTGTAPANSHFVVSFGDRAVVARTTANTQLIQWSISGNVRNWSGVGSGSVSLVDSKKGEDAIMGLKVHGDTLVVYRRESVWVGRRTGQPSPAFQWQYRHGTGVLAEQTIADAGALGDFYLGRDDVYLYHPRMAEPQRVGTPISNDIFDNLNRSGSERHHAHFNEDRQEYWLFTAKTGETFPTSAYVLDVRRFRATKQLVWRERQFNSGNDNISAAAAVRTGDFTDVDTERKLCMATDIGESFDSDISDTSDDGGSITLEYRSPQFSLPDRLLQMRKLAISYTATSPVDITLDTSIDGGTTWDDAVTYTLPAQAVIKPRTFWIRSAVYEGVQFRLRCSDTDRVLFRTYQLGLMPRGPFRSIA